MKTSIIPVKAFILLVLLCTTAPLKADDVLTRFDSLFDSLYSVVDFLPEYHMEADLSTFALHKNDFYRRRYCFEGNMNLEFVFFSVRKLVYSTWEFGLLTGAGQVPENLAFSLLDIDYTIIPAFELRLQPLFIQCGIEHRCFHEIDRTEFGLVHWNKVYLGFMSPNARSADYWQGLASHDNWKPLERFSWKLRAGFFPYSWFGAFTEFFISRDNWREYEADLDLRYTFFRLRSWMVNARTKTTVGYWNDHASDQYGYWRQDFILENNFRRGDQGMLLYVQYTLDGMPLYNGQPRFNKDQLLQFGVRFFY